jgi:type II secretory pathway pseudopilin PulG
MATRQTHSGPARHQIAGFSATELLVAVQIVGILAAVTVNTVGDALDRARVAHRMDELRGLQAAVWSASDNGIAFPDPASFWHEHAPKARPGRYTLLVNGDPANGDVDLNDGHETDGDRGTRRVEFVILCEDDFGDRAEYLYIEDSGPPRLVTGRADDPGYRRFGNRESDGGKAGVGGSAAGASSSGGGAGGTTSDSLVGWGGAETPRTESPVRDFIAQRRADRIGAADPQQSAPGHSGGRSTSSSIGD